MIQSKEFTTGGKKYLLFKLPATIGRRIMATYGVAPDGKIENYASNEAAMLSLMEHVEAVTPHGNVKLINEQVLNNHVSSWEDLTALENAMIEYNCSFLQGGRPLNSSEGIAPNTQLKISKT